MSEIHGGSDGKRETILLMDVASLFTRGHLTGEQGLAVLEAAESLVRTTAKPTNTAGCMACSPGSIRAPTCRCR